MAKSIVRVDGKCPVCSHAATIGVADFPLATSSTAFATLFHCLNCRSAHFRHEPVDVSAINWHLKVMPRNLGWSAHLAKAIQPRLAFSSVIDVGCGVGTWLSYLASIGIRGLGFEPGTKAARYGRETLGLEVHAGYFEAQSAREQWGKFDLVTCIMVLEHLPEPRRLIKEIADYCVATGASAYISVPLYYGFQQLHFDDESKSHSVFNNVAAHVTYFSEIGLTMAFQDHGMVPASGKIVPESKNWSGILFSPKIMQ